LKSLRARIFALVAAATLLAWGTAAAWTYVNTRADIQRVLDNRLVEAARMVASLTGDFDLASSQPNKAFDQRPFSSYTRQLSCQIWSLDGRLIGRSDQAPAEPLSLTGSGFSERQIGGATWRVYSLTDRGRGIRVVVGDNLAVRQRLISNVMSGLLIPFIAAVIGLSILIWAAVDRGLSPLRAVTRQLRRRDPSDFRPLGIDRADHELLPVIAAIDGLFGRLAELRENERHFIASAAHELQTPLAGLRTHAQIALRATDGPTRETSLLRIQASVDRTSRLVHQLLELAREESGMDVRYAMWTRVGDVIDGLNEELAPQLEHLGIALRCSETARHAEVLIDDISLTLALRNLVDNAIQHSPSGSTVDVDLQTVDDETRIIVLDQGRGINVNEIDRVKDRFVRGSSAKGQGSGLGLSIVELVISRIGGQLEISNRPQGGLSASLVFPASLARLSRQSALVTP
jgi:two-component system, OmpR family, sensor histidine kinase QseC